MPGSPASFEASSSPTGRRPQLAEHSVDLAPPHLPRRTSPHPTWPTAPTTPLAIAAGFLPRADWDFAVHGPQDCAADRAAR
jgi:hypothetical protein